MNKRSINFVTMTISFVVLAAALLASPAHVHAQKNKIDAVREKIEKADAESRKKIALKRLAAERKEKAAAGEKRRRGGNEREVAMQQIKIMRLAQQGLLDTGRKDLADMLKHSIHAQELALEGVRNEKAAHVYKTAPSLGQRVELMLFAAQKLHDAGKKEQASSVGRLGEQLLKRFRAQQKQGGNSAKREGQRKGRASEREVAAAQIEVMQTALVALREAERKDWADVVSRSIQARLVRLKQLKGPQAKIALEREPKLEQTVKALFAAADQWREYRNQKNAGAVRALANKFGAFREGARKERPRKSDGLQRLKQFEAEVAELKAALERRLRELKELEQKRDR